ncbi:hypothetical protein [Methylocucumis oryzae]|nr:hypothetical protein [Methylocucumis oryzae]
MNISHGHICVFGYQRKAGQGIHSAGRREYVPVGLAAASMMPTPAL